MIPINRSMSLVFLSNEAEIKIDTNNIKAFECIDNC